MPAMNKFQYSARDFTAIRDALLEKIRVERPDLISEFENTSNIGNLLLEMVAYIGELNAFSINRIGEEAFPATAQRYASMLRHAEYAGYTPKSTTAASATMTVNPLPSQLSSQSMRIAKGTSISIGSLVFEVDKEYLFPTGSTEATFNVVEGKTTTDEFEGTGNPWQTFTTSLESVIDGSWTVRVNGVEWAETDFVALEVGGTETYSVSFDENGKADFRFGDDSTGRAPADGATIEITYRSGGGEGGNLPAYALAATLTAYFGSSAAQIQAFNPASASGGQDRESIDELRRNIPASIRSMDKCISIQDYADQALIFNDPSTGRIARAKATLREGALLELLTGWGAGTVEVPEGTDVTVGSYRYRTLNDMVLNGGNPNLVVDPNTVDIWVWVIGTHATDGYETYGAPSTVLRESLLNYLDERSIATVMPVVRDGALYEVDVDLGTVIVDRRYDLGDVHDRIMQTAVDFFMQDSLEPGDAFILSDFYNVIENTEGVKHFTIQQPVDNVEVGEREMVVRGSFTYSLQYEERDVPKSIIGRY